MLECDSIVEVFFILFRVGYGKPRSWVEIIPQWERVSFLMGIPYCPPKWERIFLYVAPVEGMHPWWLRRSDCRPRFPLSWRRVKVSIPGPEYNDPTEGEQTLIALSEGISPLDVSSPTSSVLEYSFVIFLVFFTLFGFLLTRRLVFFGSQVWNRHSPL